MENRIKLADLRVESIRTHVVEVRCPKCNWFRVSIRGREHDDGTKWLQGDCDCGFRYKNFAVDFIQPNNPFYHLLYKSFDDEYNRKKKVVKLEEEQRKADLDRKYFEKYRGVQKSTMTLLEKSIRKEVLNGD